MSLPNSPSIGSLFASNSGNKFKKSPSFDYGNNPKELQKSPSTYSLSKLWMIHVELVAGHNLAIRDRSGTYCVVCAGVCVHKVYTPLLQGPVTLMSKYVWENNGKKVT